MELLPVLERFTARYALDPKGPIAVAVSGGADSLCLAFLLQEAGFNVTALSINHGLREDSAAECDYVGQIMQQAGIPHQILHWQGEKPQANIQAAARTARYDLLKNWCLDHQIPTLAVGHHRDDQAETVLLRLLRGSGVKGLAAMQPCVDMGGGVTVIRPLLEVPKQSLVTYVQKRGLDWVDDPSNQNTDFDRIKVRHFMQSSTLSDLSPELLSERLADTATAMARAQAALDHYTHLWLKNAVGLDCHGGAVTLTLESLSSDPEEIILRGLSMLFQWLSDQPYPPRFKKLQALLVDLKADGFAGTTLSSVQILPSLGGDALMLIPELRTIKSQRVSPDQFPKTLPYAGAFEVAIDWDDYIGDEELTLEPLGEAGWLQVKDTVPYSGLSPHKLQLIQPVLRGRTGIIAAKSVGLKITAKPCRWLSA